MFGLFYIAVPNVMLYRFVLFSALAQIFFFIAFTALSWDCLLVLHRKTRSVNFMSKEEELKWNYERGLLSPEEATQYEGELGTKKEEENRLRGKSQYQ